MIQVTPHMRILVAVEPVDFRAGIDALVGVCRQRLASDPFDGGLFVFANRRRSAIKIPEFRRHVLGQLEGGWRGTAKPIVLDR